MPPLPSDDDCTPCCTTNTPCVSAEPGPPGEQGPAGSDGVNGSDGSNAYTFLTASFDQPAEDASVVVAVEEGLWASVGQTVYVQTGGYYLVAARSALTITLTNLGYAGNASEGFVIANAQQISPAGTIGVTGTLTGAAGGRLSGNYPDPDLANSGVTAGIWTKVTVDLDGTISSGDTLIPSDYPEAVLLTTDQGPISGIKTFGTTTNYLEIDNGTVRKFFYGGGPAYNTRRYNGSVGTPTAILDSNVLGVFTSRGFDGTGFSTDPDGQLSFVANENFTPTAKGTYALLRLTLDGTSSLVDSYKFGTLDFEILPNLSLALASVIKMTEGANASGGLATLVNGTVTIATTAVQTGDHVVLTHEDVNASTAIGTLQRGAIVNATSVVVNSLDATGVVEVGDLSSFHWMIVRPA